MVKNGHEKRERQQHESAQEGLRRIHAVIVRTVPVLSASPFLTSTLAGGGLPNHAALA